MWFFKAVPPLLLLALAAVSAQPPPTTASDAAVPPSSAVSPPPPTACQSPGGFCPFDCAAPPGLQQNVTVATVNGCAPCGPCLDYCPSSQTCCSNGSAFSVLDGVGSTLCPPPAHRRLLRNAAAVTRRLAHHHDHHDDHHGDNGTLLIESISPPLTIDQPSCLDTNISMARNSTTSGSPPAQHRRLLRGAHGDDAQLHGAGGDVGKPCAGPSPPPHNHSKGFHLHDQPHRLPDSGRKPALNESASSASAAGTSSPLWAFVPDDPVSDKRPAIHGSAGAEDASPLPGAPHRLRRLSQQAPASDAAATLLQGVLPTPLPASSGPNASSSDASIVLVVPAPFEAAAAAWNGTVWNVTTSGWNGTQPTTDAAATWQQLAANITVAIEANATASVLGNLSAAFAAGAAAPLFPAAASATSPDSASTTPAGGRRLTQHRTPSASESSESSEAQPSAAAESTSESTTASADTSALPAVVAAIVEVGEAEAEAAAAPATNEVGWEHLPVPLPVGWWGGLVNGTNSSDGGANASTTETGAIFLGNDTTPVITINITMKNKG